MSKKKFLPVEELKSLREELYELSEHCLKYLRKLSKEKELDITSVKCGNPSFCSEEVKVPLNPEDKGAIFHEIAHGFFEASVFHSKNENISKEFNEEWGEAFAEAIRWLMEKQHLPESKWLEKFDEGRKEHGSDKHKAFTILRKCGKTAGGFGKFWAGLTKGFEECQDEQDQKHYLYNRLS